jgi:O-antigen/teichoic acid export membrane protein
MLQNSAINFLISIFYGQVALGYYAMAYRVLRAPLGVIGAAISQVLYQTMSENYNNKHSNIGLFNSTLRYVAGISVPLFIFIASVAPWSFSMVLGSDWKEAGWYVVFLTPLFMMTFMSSPLSHLPNITGYQGTFLLLVTSINIVSLVVFSVAHYLLSEIYFSLASYAFIWFIGYAFILMWLRILAHKTNKDVSA